MIALECSPLAIMRHKRGYKNRTVEGWCKLNLRIPHRDADHPSNLLLSITKGNVVGTYLSGGLLG